MYGKIQKHIQNNYGCQNGPWTNYSKIQNYPAKFPNPHGIQSEDKTGSHTVYYELENMTWRVVFPTLMEYNLKIRRYIMNSRT